MTRKFACTEFLFVSVEGHEPASSTPTFAFKLSDGALLRDGRYERNNYTGRRDSLSLAVRCNNSF
jgi:hypothetical protein